MTPYDEVLYPTHPQSQTHPDRLATLAHLFGMRPAPVERCRVLELGTGDGGNLIPMAFGLPESRFTGLDLAEGVIQSARRTAAELGLGNIRFLHMDLMDLPEDFGEFDYIIAHGLYSWVPQAVRDRLLTVCRRHLSPQGVAFVSYNVYPGAYMRDMARDMMLYHAEGIENPADRIREARGLMELIREAGCEPGLDEEFENVLRRDPGALYHDELNPVSYPVYFREFNDHAAHHGLQFLAEAFFYAMQPASIPPGPRRTVEAIEDVIRQQQYLDFLKLRRFRQTLICRAELKLERPAAARRVCDLLASCPARPASGDTGGAVEFRGERGAKAQTAHPLAKAALLYLGEVFPRRVPFSRLLAEARERCSSREEEERDTGALSEILFYSYVAGLTELHSYAPPFTGAPGERPEASALARLQNRRGPWVATLCHGLAEIDDAIGRRLVDLLDGTRDRTALARELAPLVPSGEIAPDGLERSLERLARLPLLVS